ncbi:MAG: hypothetical protein A3K77_06360 [Euryarchaeota archaeon RBG_13_31_8]|nr:MAG: hypothetical protein A3K77_06360 [Euryarchaeota archaeon RBG_13_31_8]
MKFDSLFDVQQILNKIGFGDVLDRLETNKIEGNTVDEKLKNQFPFFAKEIVKITIANFSLARDELYILIEKETGFKREELESMNHIEVFSLIKDIFKDGIPPAIFENLKKTL